MNLVHIALNCSALEIISLNQFEMLEINQSALSIRLQRTDSQLYFFGDDES